MSVIAPAAADAITYYFPHSEPLEVPVREPRPSRFYGGPRFQAHLSGEIGNSLVAVQPLSVNIERDEDFTYLVSDDIFLVYGDGEDIGAALYDYVASLLEFYDMLKDSTDPFDQKQFAQLQSYIQPKLQRGYDAVQASRD